MITDNFKGGRRCVRFPVTKRDSAHNARQSNARGTSVGWNFRTQADGNKQAKTD